MTSKHGRLSILVVTLTLSACTSAGGAPSGDATQPPARHRNRQPVDRAVDGGRGIAESDARAVSQPRGQLG